MIITSRIDLINNSYHVTIGLDPGPDALTEVEKNALAAFGEPVITLGGTFTPSPPPATAPLTFTLPAKNLRFPSQAPFTQIFPVTTYTTNTAAFATWYRTNIIAAIDTGVSEKVTLATNATGSGRWTDTVSTTS